MANFRIRKRKNVAAVVVAAVARAAAAEAPGTKTARRVATPGTAAVQSSYDKTTRNTTKFVIIDG